MTSTDSSSQQSHHSDSDSSVQTSRTSPRKKLESSETTHKYVRVPGETLTIIETQKETKYRKKTFPDVEKVLKEKLQCTVCSKDLKSDVREGRDIFKHRVLDVLICKSCYKFYGDGNYSEDEDGTDKYCRWCGQGGKLYCCNKCTCVFCKGCVKKNLTRSDLTKLEDDDWKCYLCDPKPLYHLRAVCWAAEENSESVTRQMKAKRLENLRKMKGNLSKKDEKLSREKSGRSSKALKRGRHSSLNESDDEQPTPKKSKSNPSIKINQNRNKIMSRSGNKRTKESSSDDKDRTKEKVSQTKGSVKLMKKNKLKYKKSDSSDSTDNKSRSLRHKSKVKYDENSDENSDSDSSGQRKTRSKCDNKTAKWKESNSSSSSSDDRNSSVNRKLNARQKIKDRSASESEKKVYNATNDSESSFKSTDKLKTDKKKIKVAYSWMLETLADTQKFSKLLSKKVLELEKHKINLRCIRTCEDVIKMAEGLDKMYNAANENLINIQYTLTRKMNVWKSEVLEKSSNNIDSDQVTIDNASESKSDAGKNHMDTIRPENHTGNEIVGDGSNILDTKIPVCCKELESDTFSTEKKKTPNSSISDGLSDSLNISKDGSDSLVNNQDTNTMKEVNAKPSFDMNTENTDASEINNKSHKTNEHVVKKQICNEALQEDDLVKENQSDGEIHKTDLTEQIEETSESPVTVNKEKDSLVENKTECNETLSPSVCIAKCVSKVHEDDLSSTVESEIGELSDSDKTTIRDDSDVEMKSLKLKCKKKNENEENGSDTDVMNDSCNGDVVREDATAISKNKDEKTSEKRQAVVETSNKKAMLAVLGDSSDVMSSTTDTSDIHLSDPDFGKRPAGKSPVKKSRPGPKSKTKVVSQGESDDSNDSDKEIKERKKQSNDDEIHK